MVVLGVQEKRGQYQGNDYHNVMLHCSKEDSDCYGVITEVIKVKFSNVSEVFGKVMSASDWSNLIGCSIIANYNRFGNIEHISVDEKEVK